MVRTRRLQSAATFHQPWSAGVLAGEVLQLQHAGKDAGAPRALRFRFMVPMRVRWLEVEAPHEPEGRAWVSSPRRRAYWTHRTAAAGWGHPALPASGGSWPQCAFNSQQQSSHIRSPTSCIQNPIAHFLLFRLGKTKGRRPLARPTPSKEGSPPPSNFFVMAYARGKSAAWRCCQFAQ